MIQLPKSCCLMEMMLRTALLTGTIVVLHPILQAQAAEAGVASHEIPSKIGSTDILVATEAAAAVQAETVSTAISSSVNIRSNDIATPETIAMIETTPMTLPKAVAAHIVKSHQAFTKKSLSQSEILSKQSFLEKTPHSLHSVETLLVADTTPQLISDASKDSEDVESLRKKLLIEPLAELRVPGFAPGSTAGGPSAFGADFADAFVGISGSNRRARASEADGTISAGFGVGDANKSVGLEVNVNIGSLRRFAANGDVGFKLHRNLSKDAAIAFGWDSGIRWGDENKNTDSTLYGVASKIFELKPNDEENKMPLTVSVGLGSGRFRSFDDANAKRRTVGVFGSVGLQVAPQASIVSTWTGRDLNLGISVVPIKTQPFFVTAVVANVLGRDDASTVYSLSLGYGFDYSKLFGSK